MAMDWTQTGTRVLACAVAQLLVSAVAVALRLISRGRILHILGPTDWFMVLTLVGVIGASLKNAGARMLTTIPVLRLRHIHLRRDPYVCLAANGLGCHIADLSHDEIRSFFKAMYMAMILSSLSLIMTKISVLLLFLDIFVITWARKATYIVMCMVVLYGLWLVTSTIVFGVPVYSFWDIFVPDRKCLFFSVKWTADAAVNLALEVLIFCLPLPVLGLLTLPWRQKLWVCFAFSLGGFVCIVSGMRFRYLDFQGLKFDPPWGGVMMAYWFTIEINVPIFIACIPTIKPLVAKVCPRLLESAAGSELTNDCPNPPTISSPPSRTQGSKMFQT
ncbi:hypothetical protein VTI74DRAFT_8403 [Chaetomium olivicolor]